MVALKHANAAFGETRKEPMKTKRISQLLRRGRWSLKWLLGTVLPALLLSSSTHAKTSDITSRVQTLKQKLSVNESASINPKKDDSLKLLQWWGNGWSNWVNWSNWNNWNNWKNWNNFDNWQKFSNIQ